MLRKFPTGSLVVMGSTVVVGAALLRWSFYERQVGHLEFAHILLGCAIFTIPLVVVVGWAVSRARRKREEKERDQ